MESDYKLNNRSFIHDLNQNQVQEVKKTRIPSASIIKRLCNHRNPCKAIALVHPGSYHLSCITYNLVFNSKSAYIF